MNSKTAVTILVIFLTFIIGFVCGFKAGNVYKSFSDGYCRITNRIYGFPQQISQMPKDIFNKISEFVSSDDKIFLQWKDELLRKHINIVYALGNEFFDDIKDVVIDEAVNCDNPKILEYIVKNKVVSLSDEEAKNLLGEEDYFEPGKEEFSVLDFYGYYLQKLRERFDGFLRGF